MNCSSEQNKNCPQRHRYGCSPQAVPVRGTVTDVAPLRGKVVHGAGPPAEHCIGPRCVQQPEEGKDEESSHASSFSLQSGVVCSGHGVPGVHIAVHTHGDTLLLRVVQCASRLAYALLEAFIGHSLQQLLSVSHRNLDLDLLHDGTGVHFPAGPSC